MQLFGIKSFPLFLVFIFTAVASNAAPVSTLSVSELIEQLKLGGNIIYLRHASTELSSVGDDLSSCELQRNLSEKGRDEARHIGQSIHRLKYRLAMYIPALIVDVRIPPSWLLGSSRLTITFSFQSKKIGKSQRCLGNIFFQSCSRRRLNRITTYL